MGKPALVIIINHRAFIIEGAEYDDRFQAITLAIKMFENEQIEIDKLRHNEDMTLRKDADPEWFSEEIETIRIFVVC